MREIPLTRGLVTLVDDEDFDLLSCYKWRARRGSCESRSIWYAYGNDPSMGEHGKGRLIMHRLILDAGAGQFVDHINGDGLDNRRVNLRICSNQENQFNRYARLSRYSRYKGVTWHKGVGKWQAAIKADGRCLYLGLFINEVAAAMAYDDAARRYFGEFANTNFPITQEVVTA